MNYLIKLECINNDNKYNLNRGQFTYIGDVFGSTDKCTKDKDYAYKFISASRVNMICNKVDKNVFKTSIIKTY